MTDRFTPKYVKEPNSGCWLWTAATGKGGYGVFRHRRQTMQAHRASWDIHNGPIPDGAWVLHHCDTPPCVNPAHLFLGDHDANMADAARKGRNAHGSKAPHSILTEAQAGQIKGLLNQGRTVREVADQIGVDYRLVDNIKRGKNWVRVAAEGEHG